MAITLFLGAGFSKWACGLPLTSQLFDYQIKCSISDTRKLEVVKGIKSKWDANSNSANNEEFFNYAYKDCKQSEVNALIWYLCRRLSEPFIHYDFYAGRYRRHVLMIDENRKLKVDGIRRVIDFLTKVRLLPVAGIITTNYDLIVEYCLGTKGFNYGHSFEVLSGRGAYPLSNYNNPVMLKGSIQLAKLHGSISWDKDCKYTDGRCGINGKAMIVPPIITKQLPQLSSQWNLAKKILNESSYLVFFGFGFNAYDTAVKNLIIECTANLYSVLIIDPNSHNLPIEGIFNTHVRITSMHPDQFNINTIPNWIKT